MRTNRTAFEILETVQTARREFNEANQLTEWRLFKGKKKKKKSIFLEKKKKYYN